MRQVSRLRLCLVALLCVGLTAPVALALKTRLAHATISFGQWAIDPPLDRFPNNSPRPENNHELIPARVRIPADGAVNFLISGFHQPIIYDVGTKPDDIDATRTAICAQPQHVKSAGDGIRRPPLGRAGPACPGEVYP